MKITYEDDHDTIAAYINENEVIVQSTIGDAKYWKQTLQTQLMIQSIDTLKDEDGMISVRIPFTGETVVRHKESYRKEATLHQVINAVSTSACFLMGAFTS